MPPKKPVTPQAPVESTDDAQLVVELVCGALQLALQVNDSSEPQAITSAASAPGLEVLIQDGPIPEAEVPWAPITLDADKGTYPLQLKKVFRYPVKGAALLEKLLGFSVNIAIRAADSKEVVASAVVDTAPFCLGESSVEAPLNLVPAAACPYKLVAGPVVQMTARLMHYEQEGTELQLRPLRLLPAAEAANCNILELLGATATPVPPSLPAAVNVAGGGLTCTLAISLPGGATTLVAAGGNIKEAGVTWGTSPRLFLSPALVQQIKDALEAGQVMQAEVGRFLGAGAEHLADPAFASYHALLALPADDLAEPGRAEVTLRAVPVCTAAQAVASGQLAASKLPVYVAPAGSRARTIEEPPSGDPEATCAWQAAGTGFSLRLRLARPLYPPWEAPPAPPRSLRELLPARPPAPPAPPKTPLESFQEEVRTLAQDLVRECRSQLEATSRPASGTSGSDGGAAAAPGSKTPAAQQAALVYHLNKSGRYLAAKEQLKGAVLRVVAASRTADASSDEAAVARLSNQLYSQLMVEVRGALEELTASSEGGAASTTSSRPGTAGGAEGPDADRLLELAAECEGAGDAGRCHRLHQRRLLACGSTPEALTDYARFCLRDGDRARAEACLREALADNSAAAAAGTTSAGTHQPALQLLVGLLLEAGQPGGPSTGGVALEQAEALAYALKEAYPSSAAAWALLGAAYRLQGKPKEPAARSCHQEVLRLAKAAVSASRPSSSSSAGGAPPAAAEGSGEGGAGASPAEAAAQELPVAANGYLAAGQAAVEARLVGLARSLLQLAAGVPDAGGGWKCALVAAQAQLALVTQEAATATSLLKQLQALLEAAAEPTTRVHVLQGDLAYEAGQLVQAKQHYRRAMMKGGAACPRDMQLRLARAFAETGDVSPALDTYLGVAAAAPRCCSAWLGAGAAYIRLQDYESADLALCEANQLDPEHPGVWGQLALAAWLQGNTQEAEQATAAALRLGLAQPDLLLQLADQAQAAGCFPRAASLLAAAGSAGGDSVTLRCKRAAVALAEARYEEASTQLVAAAALPASGQEAVMLQSIMAKLREQWPHL